MPLTKLNKRIRLFRKDRTVRRIDYREIVKLRKEKRLRIVEIALLTGLTRYTVAKIINQNGLYTSKGIKKQKKSELKPVENFQQCIETAKSLNKKGIERIGLDKLAQKLYEKNFICKQRS